VTRKIGIYLFPEVEVLDFSGPYEVFNTAARLCLRSSPEIAPIFEIVLVGAQTKPIRARGGMQIIPDVHFSEVRQLDILIIPGGVVEAESKNDDLLDWIRSIHSESEITASVCTGSFLLAHAGLLDGLEATTHWEDLDDLARMFPGVDVVETVRWVKTGKIMTSAGISAGIDMSLQIVARLEGSELAALTARQMDYDWMPT
jgi:transcriptional regulator GlxA family with amidase domain